MHYYEVKEKFLGITIRTVYFELKSRAKEFADRQRRNGARITMRKVKQRKG